MKTRKVPERLCLGCQEVRPKKELVRIVRSPEGIYSVDAKGKKPGRGASVCHRSECFDAAVKRRQFSRAFKEPMDDDVLRALREELFPTDGK